MKQFQAFQGNAEIFKWGPIPGRYFYVSEFEDAIFKEYQNFYQGERWPNTLILFREKIMVWANDANGLKRAGREVFLQNMVKESVRTKLRSQWDTTVKKLSEVERKIGDAFLEDLTDEELHALWQDFYKLIIEFWLPTIPAELGSYGSAELLKEALKKCVKNEEEIASITEILTAPGKLSFNQEEEIDLTKTKDIEKHAQKYFWLRNGYNGVENLSIDFFLKRRKELSVDVKKLMDERLIGVKNKKGKVSRKYNLPKEVKEMAKALCESLEWQDERKKQVLIYTHYKELFLKEIARRFDYNVDLLRNCSTRENLQILEKRGVHTLVENRKKLFGFFMDPLKKDIIGDEAEFCWGHYAEGNTKIE